MTEIPEHLIKRAQAFQEAATPARSTAPARGERTPDALVGSGKKDIDDSESLFGLALLFVFSVVLTPLGVYLIRSYLTIDNFACWTDTTEIEWARPPYTVVYEYCAGGLLFIIGIFLSAVGAVGSICFFRELQKIFFPTRRDLKREADRRARDAEDQLHHLSQLHGLISALHKQRESIEAVRKADLDRLEHERRQGVYIQNQMSERMQELGLPRMASNASDFESLAAEWLWVWGDSEVRVTIQTGDGGIDIESWLCLAQVKFYSNGKVSAPEVQQLRGAASVDPERNPVFFCFSTGYTNDALEFASRAGVALYQFDVRSLTFVPVNEYAENVLHYLNTLL